MAISRSQIGLLMDDGGIVHEDRKGKERGGKARQGTAMA